MAIMTFEPQGEEIQYLTKYVKERTEAIGHRPGVYVKTFGCQQNEADSERICGIAESCGYEAVVEPEAAELIVFNTCAVREHAELKALSLTGQLKHIKEKNPALVIVVCGCMTAQEHRLGDIKNKYPYVDLLFGATSLHKFPLYLSETLKKRSDTHERKKRSFYPDTDALICEGMPVHRESHYKAWVSIMYGCNNFCTYCVVPYVRGRERSRCREEILREVRDLVRDGYKEITLLGQNVNSYGKDLYGKDYGFAELLEDITHIQGEYWIRFMTSHPKDASDKLIEVMAAHCGEDSRPQIVRQFHLPLQSGSDKVLKEMNRHYSGSYYRGVVAKLRAAMPAIALTTDIIVGFPGETEDDFADTLKALEEISYDNIYSFLYSPRKGTPAAEREQIPEAVKTERFARMLTLQNRISLERNQAYVGKTVKVLVEGVSKTDSQMLTGRTEQNRLVHFAGDPKLEGSFALVKVNEADIYSLKGDLRQYRIL